jgi:hypothetical protein
MRVTLKPIEHTTIITTPHSQECIELLNQAKAQGSIFSATDGIHLMANNIFQSIVLKQCKILREKLGKDKILHEHHEKTNPLHWIFSRGGERI